MDQVKDAVGGSAGPAAPEASAPSRSQTSRKMARPSAKEKAKTGKWSRQIEALQQTVGQLLSLTLRHESQLQALASTDQFLLFLPAGPNSLTPTILSKTQQWKDQQQKGPQTQPLQVILGQTVTQETLERFTKLQTKGSKDPIWEKAVQQCVEGT